MAGNWRPEDDNPNRRRRQELTDDEALGAAIVGFGALALGAVAAYNWWTVGEDEEKKKEERSQPPQRQTARVFNFSPPSSPPRSVERVTPRYENNRSITIAVDATKERAGGILLLPKSRSIYFYSINWSNIFKFPDQADKFEMSNALLGLEIFEDYVRTYRNQYLDMTPLKLMTDNTFCTNSDPAKAYPGQKNEEYRRLFGQINEKLRSPPFSGNWQYVPDCRQHVLMRFADRLSRLDCSSTTSLPPLPNTPDPFSDCSETNISRSDYAVLHTVARYLPNELQN